MPFTRKARAMQIDFVVRYFNDHETEGDLAASALGAGYSPKYVRNNRQRLQRILDAEGKRRAREAAPARKQLPAHAGSRTWHRIKNALGGFDVVPSIPEPERPTAGEILEGTVLSVDGRPVLPDWVRGNAPDGQGQHYDASHPPPKPAAAPSYEQRHDSSALGPGHVVGQDVPSQEYLDAIAKEQREHSPEFLEAQQGFHLDGQDNVGDAAAGLGPQATMPEETVQVNFRGERERSVIVNPPTRFSWWHRLGAAARRYFE